MQPVEDHAAALERALAVLREWDHDGGGDLTLAYHEATSIVDDDGGPDQLLAGLITAAGFLLVNLEQRGQPAATTLQMLEAFRRAQEAGG